MVKAMRTTMLGVCAAAILILPECEYIQPVTGSGNIVTRDADVSGFTGVIVEDGFNVIVTQGLRPQVEITADDNVIDQITVVTEGENVRIAFPAKGLPLRSNVTLQAKVRMPRMKSLTVRRSATAKLEEIRSLTTVNLETNTAGTIEGVLTANEVTINAEQGSRITLRGGARELNLTGTGGSQVDLLQFPVATAAVNLATGSTAQVKVLRRITNATVGTASTLEYEGDPEIENENVTGASTLRKR